MKKILVPLVFVLLFLVSFALPQKKKVKQVKQKDTITRVEFEMFTRGTRSEVTITRDSAINIGRTEKKFILIPKAKWDEICVALKNVSLLSIPALEAPSKAREYDGAAHCKIIVVTKSSRYESKYFDGGQPMKQLQALYDVIESIRNTITDKGAAYVQ
ncbi:MAG TPA: hypothetical protein PLY34_11000 [Ferruginibacter sp.]|nr:hypothetical protein [Ferruginibacter sp.]